MKTVYMIFAGSVFFVFCFLEMRGVSFDSNQTLPKPVIYSSRTSSSSSSGGGSSVFYYGK